MKNLLKAISLMLITALALVFTACGGDDKSSYIYQDEGLQAGDISFYNADGAGFMMSYVPGKTFKTGTDDSGTATVSKAFWIGETEVTYELWYTVRQWAISRVTNAYTFANTGIEGNDGAGGAASPLTMEPVTMINWRDAIIWCNAATEWYNEKNSTSYTCAYYSDSAYTIPIRISTNTASVDTTNGSEDKPYIKAATNGNVDMENYAATGFRMLTALEWELAARYIDDANNDGDISDMGEYYPGNYASGAMADYTNTGANQAVAWYSSSSTHAVKGLLPNALGLYDISGNVWEWCYGNSGASRAIRGGAWLFSGSTLQIGYSGGQDSPYNEYNTLGFRLARSAD
ncbi:MAG: SUMF1/EgtB/PvdO family nonheme iron enzyme [Spirochaetota bacterium]